MKRKYTTGSPRANPVDAYLTPKISPKSPLTEELAVLIRAIRSRALSADLMELDEAYFWLNGLAHGSWYAVGLPPQQTCVEEAFSKTEDVFKLLKELMRLAKENPNVFLVVANPPNNVFSHLKHSRKEAGLPVNKKVLYEEALEEVRLIGLKDKVFYDAVQTRVCEEAEAEGTGSQLRGVNVLLMSRLNEHPHFAELLETVGNLFDTNESFAEAVYCCVPDSLRPRGHRDKTYKRLSELPGEAALQEAQERIPYVLYQIAVVLFLGGEKLGHPGEVVYDRATQMAAEALKTDIRRPPTFRPLPLPNALGKNPYRAVRAENAPNVPGALTSYTSSKALLDTGHAGLTELKAAIDAHLSRQEQWMDELLTLLARPDQRPTMEQVMGYGTELEEISGGVDSLLEEYVRRSLALRQGALAQVSVSAGRNALLGVKIRERVREDYKLKDNERSRIMRAYLRQEMKSVMAQLTQDPFHLERFLLKWSGITAALEDGISAEATSRETARWLPFVPHSDPYGWRLITDMDRIYSSGATLLAGADDGSPWLSFRDFIPDYPPRNWGEWAVKFPDYKAALFHPHMESYDRRNPVSCVNHTLATIWNRFSLARWSNLDGLFELIKGTPFESVYGQWLKTLIAQRGLAPKAEGSPQPLDVDEGLKSRVLGCLESPVFNPQFVEYFQKQTI